MTRKLNVIYMGTPDFSVPTLDLLAHHPLVNLVSVVSMPDRKSGRGQHFNSPPVVEYCKQNNISFFQTENINNEDDYFINHKNVDLIIVLAFAQFLSSKTLQHPSLGCFNIHTSLLPKYRGAAPIQHALMNGDKSTGVCIQKMEKKMDAGDICHQSIIPIEEHTNGGLLTTQLKYAAAVLCESFIGDAFHGRLKFQPQDESKVTLAPTLSREDGFLKFNELSTQQVLNKIKALDPWPGTYLFLNKKRVKVFSAQRENNKIPTGVIDTSMGTILIGTTDGSVRLTSVQFEGKKRCSDHDFLNGYKGSLEITSGD